MLGWEVIEIGCILWPVERLSHRELAGMSDRVITVSFPCGETEAQKQEVSFPGTQQVCERVRNDWGPYQPAHSSSHFSPCGSPRLGRGWDWSFGSIPAGLCPSLLVIVNGTLSAGLAPCKALTTILSDPTGSSPFYRWEPKPRERADLPRVLQLGSESPITHFSCLLAFHSTC